MRIARRGYLLVECLVVIALLGVVTTLITAALVSMLVTDRQLRATYEEGRVLQQLELQLRDDASQATSAVVTGAACRWERGTSHAWHWKIENATLHREVWESGQVVERDRYELRDDTVCHWTPDSATPATHVQCTLQRASVSRIPAGERGEPAREALQLLVSWRLRLAHNQPLAKSGDNP
jgi:type II secretory pathway pseudopilin PulG